MTREKAIYDSEYRARQDISRNMKKMESDTAEYEVQLALTQRQFSEAQKNSKDFAIQLKDINLKNDEIIKKTEEARLESDAAQRRVALMTEEVDQLRYESYRMSFFIFTPNLELHWTRQIKHENRLKFN